MTDAAETNVKLGLLQAAARRGATDGDLKCLLAKMNGEPMVDFQSVHKGKVTIKVRRVYSANPTGVGTTLIKFLPNPDDVRWWLEVNEEPSDVRSRLLDAGWNEREPRLSAQ